MKTAEKQEIATLLGFHPVSSAAADLPVTVTTFKSRSGQSLRRRTMTLRELSQWVTEPAADDKARLPLLKLAMFGNRRTPLRMQRGKRIGNSLRHNANVLTVSGCELDYDAGTMTPAEAARAFTEAGVVALIYTTPSHGQPPARGNAGAPCCRSPQTCRPRTGRAIWPAPTASLAA